VKQTLAASASSCRSARASGVPKEQRPVFITDPFKVRDSIFCELATSSLRLAVRRGNVLYAEESGRFFPVRLLTDSKQIDDVQKIDRRYGYVVAGVSSGACSQLRPALFTHDNLYWKPNLQ
jgi:hypothetical protein